MNMTKQTLGLIASLLATVALLAADSKPTVTVPTTAPAAAPKQQKLVKVCTITGVEANQEFARAVQFMQTQRQQAVELNAAIDKETDATKKKDLKAKLDELMKNLSDNNQKMVKTYRFSLERNYMLVPEVTHVYMFVSEEEAANYEKEQAAAAAAAQKDKDKKK